MGTWEGLQEAITKKRKKTKYEKMYGIGSWEHRTMADNFLNRMRQEEPGLYLAFWNGAQEQYEERIRNCVQEDYIATHILFPSFAFRFKAIVERGVDIKHYRWVIDSHLSFKSLHYMIAFQNLVQELSRQSYEWDDLKKQIKQQELESQEVFEIKDKIESLMAETISKMEVLLNPFTERFDDNTTKEESFIKLLNEKVDMLIENAQKIDTVYSSPENQLESIRQLETILKDEDVSEEMKQEAKETITEIEKKIALQKEREKKEQAELNARAIIQTSSMVHNLKRPESNSTTHDI